MPRSTPFDILCAAEAAFAKKGLYGANFDIMVKHAGTRTPAEIEFYFGFRAELYASAICFRIPEFERAHIWAEKALSKVLPDLYEHADALLLAHAATGAWAISHMLPRASALRMNANVLTLPKPIQNAIFTAQTFDVGRKTFNGMLKLLGGDENPEQAAKECRYFFNKLVIGMAALEEAACELSLENGMDDDVVTRLVFEWAVDLCQRLCLAYTTSFTPLPKNLLLGVLIRMCKECPGPAWNPSLVVDQKVHADCREVIAAYYNDVPPGATLAPPVDEDSTKHCILAATEHLAALYGEEGFPLEAVAEESMCSIEEITAYYGNRAGLIVATRLYRLPAHSVCRQKYFELIEESDQPLHARHFLWAMIVPGPWLVSHAEPNTWQCRYLSGDMMQPGTIESDVVPASPWVPILGDIIQAIHAASKSDVSIEVIAMRLRCAIAMAVRAGVAIEQAVNETWDSGATFPVIAAMCERLFVDAMKDTHAMVFGDTVPFDQDEVRWLVAESAKRAGKPEWYIGPASELSILPMPATP